MSQNGQWLFHWNFSNTLLKWFHSQSFQGFIPSDHYTMQFTVGQNILKALIYIFPINICLFQFINKNTRRRREICPKLTIKTAERPQWRRSGDFTPFSSVSIVEFEHVSICLFRFISRNTRDVKTLERDVKYVQSKFAFIV